MSPSTVYRLHHLMVYNLSLHYVWSREDAEEITQDVFLRVFEGIEGFRNESQLRTWIYRITVNTCLDFIKAKNRKKRGGGWRALFIDGPKWSDRDLIPFAHPGFDMEEREAVEEIMRVIFQLPEKQRDAIVLTKLNGESQANAAQLMGISRKALENHVQRAKVNIQIKLKMIAEKSTFYEK